jgi:hypothetical protein
MRKNRIKGILLSILLSFAGEPVFAWHDHTHLAVSQAAGYENWHNSAAADITKIKAGEIEQYNHYFNNDAGVDVTEAMVFDQVRRYDNPKDPQGHLYGAIIASIREYKAMKQSNKYAEYPLAFCAHYIGDLSMPLHNVPYTDFNKTRHSQNDGIIDFGVMNNVGYIQKNMYDMVIKNENDLAREIARIANISRQLGLRMEKENRDMTPDEAYRQIIHSASLLRAVLNYMNQSRD